MFASNCRIAEEKKDRAAFAHSDYSSRFNKMRVKRKLYYTLFNV